MTKGGAIKVKVLLFSHLKHAFGKDELEVTLPEGTTTKDLENQLRGQLDPSIAGIPLRAAVNQTYVAEAVVLQNGDEVVFIPPVQGGAGW